MSAKVKVIVASMRTGKAVEARVKTGVVIRAVLGK